MLKKERKTGLTDIHSHFVFQVDDGAVSLKDSLLLLEQAAEAGIRNLAATPHITEMATVEGGNRIERNFLKIRESVVQNQIPVNVYLASELYFSEFIYQWKNASWYTFNGNNKYLLFELPLFDLPVNVADFIFQCKLQGVSPILAHPERYLYLHNRRDLLQSWYNMGCLMQMNAGAIMGDFGQRIMRFADQLLRMKLYHFVASDAHDLENRNYKSLPAAFQKISGMAGSDYVQSLFIDNPQKAIEGQPVEVHEINRNVIPGSGFKKLLEKMKILSK